MSADAVIQKQTVRALVLQHGLKKASELSGVDYAVVRQWSARGKWKHNTIVPATSQLVTRAADNLASEIAENNRQTKASLSRSAARMAKDSESASLRHAPYVHKVAQIHAILDPPEQKPNTILNVGLLIGAEKRERVVNAQEIVDLPCLPESEGQDSGA